MVEMARYRLNVVVEKDEDGYVAHCVDLQGCHAQGGTYEDIASCAKAGAIGSIGTMLGADAREHKGAFDKLARL